MAVPPDLASLAKRYVDLWQDQLIAMAVDPDLAEALARMMAALAPSGWAAPAGNEPSGTDAACRPASIAAPSGERGDRLDELARRLAALEQRLAALEAGARGGRKRATARPRRRRS